MDAPYGGRRKVQHRCRKSSSLLVSRGETHIAKGWCDMSKTLVVTVLGMLLILGVLALAGCPGEPAGSTGVQKGIGPGSGAEGVKGPSPVGDKVESAEPPEESDAAPDEEEPSDEGDDDEEDIIIDDEDDEDTDADDEEEDSDE